ncbi:MAG: peptidoglycan editing factor PgeF, partial [Lachnospiraceae bacterium]|nr:peptidoglycan editing factor PgeF [Lachnospiraceae bacterium]
RVTKDDCGKGVTRERDYSDVDGLITNEAGVILVTLHADCMPLYFVDPVHRAIGLAHSGWRGTALGIGQTVVKMMGEHFGTKPEDFICVLGPAICETHYEVGEDVHEAFFNSYGADCDAYRLFTPSPILKGKYFFSLARANRMVLERAQVPGEKIHDCGLCTYCESDLFFSHRRDGEKRGNMAAMLSLVE